MYLDAIVAYNLLDAYARHNVGCIISYSDSAAYGDVVYVLIDKEYLFENKLYEAIMMSGKAHL
jgi:hypothetical protein|tara:strand:- start:26 stop:214 length:189 start_codon:yes stop_codon:yes gene_type:complete